jgi:hypothetical protein
MSGSSSNLPSAKRGWCNFERELAAETRNVPISEIETEVRAIDAFTAEVQNTRAQFNTIARARMTAWIDEAREASKQNNQEGIAEVLLKKNNLDMLMASLEKYLREINSPEQLKFITDKKTEIEQLASALRAKQGDGKGPVKKRKSTRRRGSSRRRRHRKSNHRRRSRRHRK